MAAARFVKYLAESGLVNSADLPAPLEDVVQEEGPAVSVSESYAMSNMVIYIFFFDRMK